METHPAFIPADPDEVRTLRDLLARIPTAWQPFNIQSLTSVEADVLVRLVSAGMVERRLGVRIRWLGHPFAIEATVRAFGEGGLYQAISPVLSRLFDQWRPNVEEWIATKPKQPWPIVVEGIPPSEWRLSSEGVKAKRDFEGSDPSLAKLVSDFVFRKGPYHYRPDVAGSGTIEAVQEKSRIDWREGAKVISDHMMPRIAEEFASQFAAFIEKSKTGMGDQSGSHVLFFEAWPAASRELMRILWDRKNHGKDLIAAKLNVSKDGLRKRIEDCEKRLENERPPQPYEIEQQGGIVRLRSKN